METWQVILLLVCILIPFVIYHIYKNGIQIKLPSWNLANPAQTATPATPATAPAAHGTHGGTAPATPPTNPVVIVRNAVISFIVYILMLGIIYLKIPSLWISWTTPMMFFVLTNLALIFAILKVKTSTWSTIIIIIVVMFILGNWIAYGVDQYSINHPKKVETENVINNTTNSSVSSSGKEIATMNKPIRAYLDPLKNYIRIIGPGNAKCVLESNPSKFFIFDEKPGVNKHIKKWRTMSAGYYLIYPDGTDEIVFLWY